MKPAYLIVHSDHPLDPVGPNSGAEMASLNQARYLARAGRKVFLAARLKTPLVEDQGVTFIDLGPTYDVEAAFDLVEKHGPYVLLATGKAFALVASRRRSGCIHRLFMTHDRCAGDSGLKPEVLEHLCDEILCASQTQKDKLVSEGAPAHKMIVTYYGVDFSIFEAAPPKTHNPRKLVFAGALVPDKGLHLLIGSFVDLKTKYPDLVLDVFGTASLWSREEYLDINHLSKAVPGLNFRGKASQKDIAKAFGQAGICVVPSIWFDPFPLTSLEAQACGTPVVAFKMGGLPEGIREGETGLVVENVDQHLLTRALDSLLANPARLQDMSKKAADVARERFRWEIVVGEIIKLSEGVTAEPPPLRETIQPSYLSLLDV